MGSRTGHEDEEEDEEAARGPAERTHRHPSLARGHQQLGPDLFATLDPTRLEPSRRSLIKFSESVLDHALPITDTILETIIMQMHAARKFGPFQDSSGPMGGTTERCKK